MNIFFTSSIRGGRAHQPQYASVVKALERYGTVSSGYVSDDTLSEYGETSLAGAEILKRELASLAACDIVIAEVTAPSLGVGYLIAHATSLGKKVIALYLGDDTEKLSGIIKGDSHVVVHTYKTDEDIERILKETFTEE